MNWIESNLNEEPSLEGISRHVGYSSFYCSVKFHEMTGMTIKKYISSRKIALAAESLINSDLKIIDIAIRHGFSSHEAFTRAFTGFFNCSPLQYRKRFNVNSLSDEAL